MHISMKIELKYLAKGSTMGNRTNWDNTAWLSQVFRTDDSSKVIAASVTQYFLTLCWSKLDFDSPYKRCK